MEEVVEVVEIEFDGFERSDLSLNARCDGIGAVDLWWGTVIRDCFGEGPGDLNGVKFFGLIVPKSHSIDVGTGFSLEQRSEQMKQNYVTSASSSEDASLVLFHVAKRSIKSIKSADFFAFFMNLCRIRSLAVGRYSIE